MSNRLAAGAAGGRVRADHVRRRGGCIHGDRGHPPFSANWAPSGASSPSGRIVVGAAAQHLHAHRAMPNGSTW